MRSTFIIVLCLFSLSYSTTLAQCPGTEPLTTGNLIVTDSRCENSGSVTAIASGGVAPYLFTLTSSATTITSTDGQFAALRPGTYQLRVTDQCNTQLTQNIIIVKRYDPLQVSASAVTPLCPGASNGSIEITVQNGGRSPFLYSLIAPSEVVSSPQAGNIFTGLPAGNYTYRVEDSCGNFQTRAITVQNNNDFRIDMNATGWLWENCNRYVIEYKIIADAGADATASYQVQFTLPDGSSSTRTVANTGTVTSGSIPFNYEHQHGALAPFTITVTNGCGIQKSKQVDIPFNMEAIAKPGSCGIGYDYVFDELRDNSAGSMYFLRCDMVRYTLISPSGTVLDSKWNNSSFKGFPPGNGYKVAREDCCGKDTLSFNWQAAAPMTLTAVPNPADKAGTAIITIRTNTGVPGELVILSGPPSISFSDGSSFPYRYPETIADIQFTASGSARVGYFTAGNYRIKFTDTCGNQSTMNVAISAANPRHLKKITFDAGMQQGCINANKIWYKGTNNNLTPDNLRLTGTVNRSFSLSAVYDDTIKNLTHGNYRLSYVFNPNTSPTHKLAAHSGIGPDIIVRDFLIPIYRSPNFSPQAAIAGCGGLYNFAVIPNDGYGIEPFQFDITGGPVPNATQESPVFSNMPAGVYSIRIADACGNSYSSQLSINEPALPVVTVLDQICSSNNLVIAVDGMENLYYSYSWEHPDGQVSWEKNLVLDPFTTSNIGSYKLTITSIVDGCVNTKDTTILLAGCVVLPVRFLDFSVTPKERQHLLRWTVAELEPQQYFIVQQSNDGRHFSNIATVYPRERKKDFVHVVPANNSGKQWYRIAIMENDRIVIYSKIAGTGTVQSGFAINPNPVLNGQLLIQLPAFRSTGSLSIYDITGRLLQQRAVNPGTQLLQWNIPGLPAGNYHLVLQTPETKLIQRFVR